MLISAFLQVWVVESSMEVTARQLLLLYLALMPQGSMGNNGVWDLVNIFTYTRSYLAENINEANQLDPSPFLEKAEAFLELFGNSEIRSQTAEMLQCAALQLSLSVTETQETPTHPCLDTAQLKVPLCGPEGCYFPSRLSTL